MTAKTAAQAEMVAGAASHDTSWTGMRLIGGESTRPCVGFRPVS